MNTKVKSTKPEESDNSPIPEIVIVTPSMARNWLDNNKFHNRNLRDNLVTKMAGDITSGKWIFDGNSIKFDKEGNVIDGQHRLWAVIKSQRAVRMMIIKNITEEAKTTIDTGAPRTIADVLHFKGYKNSAALGAAGRLSIIYHEYKGDMVKGAKSDRGKKGIISFNNIIEEIKKYPVIFDGVNRFSGYRFCIRFIGLGITALLWSIFSRIDKTQADEFFYLLDKGVDLPKESPISMLRNTLILREHLEIRFVKAGQYRAAYVMGIIIKAWNAYREDQVVKRLQFRPDFEKFPTAI